MKGKTLVALAGGAALLLLLAAVLILLFDPDGRRLWAGWAWLTTPTKIEVAHWYAADQLTYNHTVLSTQAKGNIFIVVELKLPYKVVRDASRGDGWASKFSTDDVKLVASDGSVLNPVFADYPESSSVPASSLPLSSSSYDPWEQAPVTARSSQNSEPEYFIWKLVFAAKKGVVETKPFEVRYKDYSTPVLPNAAESAVKPE